MVTCQLCKKDFKSLTPSHLKKAHSVTMAEYRAKFPDAPLRDVSDEQRERYSQSAKAVWADPEYKARNAPRLAAMAQDANAALQEKRLDPEFSAVWKQAHTDAMDERRLPPVYCSDCGDEVSPGHARCFPCYQAWRLEAALHPCENPDCENPVKGRLKYCSPECMVSDPAYVEAKKRAGKISQEMHPETADNIYPGWHKALDTPEVREKQRKATSAYMKGRPKPVEQRKKMSAARIRHWRALGVTGEARNRPYNWNLISERIRKRDKRRCLICGCPKTHRALDVHHINGDWQDNRDVNLATLCSHHHGLVTSKGNVWRPWLLPEELQDGI